MLYLDCFSGISGDMAVGALADLGVPEEVFHSAIEALGIGGAHLHFQRAIRQNIEGCKFKVHDHGHAHPHDAGEHAHKHGGAGHVHGRNHAEIRTLISGSRLSDRVKEKALAIFSRIAVAEGKIHGVPPAEVGFHEVGAVDSIADIVCFCAGLEALGWPAVCASSLCEGTGPIRIAHGTFYLPAPATLEILTGIPLRQVDEPYEFITPTGAALLAEFSVSFGPMPELTLRKIGYGVGTRDTPARPNVLRAILGDAAAPGDGSDSVVCIETNLDDASPELLGAVMDRLFERGALDVFFVPAQMKKNRPGTLLSVLCSPADADPLATLLLRETTAFGVRFSEKRRLKLARETRVVDTSFGPVTVKIGRQGNEVWQVAPEFESAREVAVRCGVPLAEVYAAARQSAGVKK